MASSVGVAAVVAFSSSPLLLGCGASMPVSSPRTTVEPLPLKVGTLRDNSIELGIPISLEAKPTGGWRSPIEVRIRILLTSPAEVPLPLEPNGVTGGLRVRW